MSIRVCLSLLASLSHRPAAKMLRRNRLRGFVRGTAALSAVLCLGAAGAQAATFTVSSTSDAAGSATTPGTLRYALSNLDSGAAANTNTINITATGAITLTSALPAIANGVTITGPGANLLTISGAGAYQVFDFSVGAEVVSIAGLTIANGNSSDIGGGIYFQGQALTVTGCTFSGNAAGSGGGIADSSLEASTLTVTNSTFSGNSANYGGGGIADSNPGSTLTVTDSTFSGNSASDNGGGIVANAEGGTLTVTDSTFSGNSAASSLTA